MRSDACLPFAFALAASGACADATPATLPRAAAEEDPHGVTELRADSVWLFTAQRLFYPEVASIGEVTWDDQGCLRVGDRVEVWPPEYLDQVEALAVRAAAGERFEIGYGAEARS
jgi:hypothetical protein